MPLRNSEPPRADLLGRELGEAHVTQVGGRLPEQPAELRDRHALTLMRLEVLLDPLAERQRRTAIGEEPGQLVPKRPLRLRLAAEPANLQLAEQRPATRYR